MNQTVKIQFETTGDRARKLAPPMRASAGAAGYDLRANVEGLTTIAPQKIAIIPTGLKIALPEGYEAQIRPRSGLAIKHGVTVMNAPGTIDWDYRGEIMVGLINLGDTPFDIEWGMRIAQMVVAPVTLADFQAGELDGSERGEGGFGSTGLR